MIFSSLGCIQVMKKHVYIFTKSRITQESLKRITSSFQKMNIVLLPLQYYEMSKIGHYFKWKFDVFSSKLKNFINILKQITFHKGYKFQIQEN